MPGVGDNSRQVRTELVVAEDPGEPSAVPTPVVLGSVLDALLQCVGEFGDVAEVLLDQSPEPEVRGLVQGGGPDLRIGGSVEIIHNLAHDRVVLTGRAGPGPDRGGRRMISGPERLIA